jgi:hypothetical protein
MTQKGQHNPTRIVLELEHETDDDFCLSDIGRGHARHYYSAYIWVMFSLSVHGRAESARHAGTWEDLLPFFVHGNVADHDTMSAYKELLIEQLTGAVKKLTNGDADLVLRYECAFDDSSGGSVLLPFKSKDEKSLRELFIAAIAGDKGLQELSSKGRLIVEPEQSNLELAMNAHDLSPYAACKLPAIVAGYYEHLRGERAANDAGL